MNFYENVENELALMKEIEKQLKPILDKGSLEQYQEGMNAKDKAHSSLQLGYQLTSFYYVYLKLNGIDPQTNPIMKEIERVQNQFKRNAKLNGQLIEEKCTQSIDKPAVKRILTHEMNNNKQQLGEQYRKKQQSLIMEEENDNSRRFEVHEKKKDETNLDIWKDDNKQVIAKGKLMPKTVHLNWKSQIDKIMK